MNTPPSSILKPIGLLAFLATAVIGWNLAAPSARVAPGKEEETKRARHPSRPSRSEVSDTARNRVASLRAIADPEARMLATIALANSLSPADFAAWMDGRWFTLRGGPEHLLFDRILMERWRNEDPESLLAWSAKNKNNAAAGIAREWADTQPERLLEFFKTHRDDAAEMSALAQIARNSPELALARLQEMIAGGLIGTTESASAEVLKALLEKSPDTLLGILDSLPPGMKLTVEGAMSRKRLDTSFSEEIRSLWENPDGWKIFFAAGIDKGISEKLLGELANLPQEWRAAITLNSWTFFNSGNAENWFDADFEGAGFPSESARAIRLQGLQMLAYQNPEAAITRMAGIEIDPRQRKQFLDRAISRIADPEKLQSLLPQLKTDEERAMVTKKIEAITATAQQGNAATSGDSSNKPGKTDAAPTAAYADFSSLQNRDPRKISQLTARFKELPPEQKQQIAKVIVTSSAGDSTTSPLKGDAIRYLLENPPAKVENADPWQSASFASASYAVNLSKQDPEAASVWVKTLPSGEEKAWTQRNLYNNWKQYDPKAADQWKKSLPPTELSALNNLPSR